MRFVFVIMSAVALAQTPPAYIAAAAGIEYYTTPPTPTSPHICSADHYPRSSLLRGEQGAVTISFVIGPEGSPRDAIVVDSSGSPSLDARALECVTSWKYYPAMLSGQPVAMPWSNRIVFSLDPPGGPESAYERPVSADSPHLCPVKDYPAEAIKACAEGIATLSLQIATDGSVSKVHLVSSSGNTALDRTSIDCVSRWKYAPWVPEEGQPDSFSWEAKAVWRLPVLFLGGENCRGRDHDRTKLVSCRRSPALSTSAISNSVRNYLRPNRRSMSASCNST
jgi:TonB family protein